MPRQAFSRETMHRHIRSNIASVPDIRGFPDGAVRSTRVVVIPADHDGARFFSANHIVKFQGYSDASFHILIEHSRLGADDEVVLPSIFYPIVIIAILGTPFGVNAVESGFVGFAQILLGTTQADPTKGAVSIVEKFGSRDGLDEIGIDEAVLFIQTVAGKLVNSCVVHAFHERITVFQEETSPFRESAYATIMPMKTGIHQFPVFAPILFQQLPSFFVGNSLGGVAAFVGDMTRGLVRENMNVDFMFHEKLQKIHDVPSIGYDKSLLILQRGFRFCNNGFQILRCIVYPAFLKKVVHRRGIHFGYYGYALRDLSCFSLGATDAPKPRGDIEEPSEVVAVFLPCRISGRR